MDQLLHPLSILTAGLVLLSYVFSIAANYKKATKKDLTNLGRAVDAELKKQRDINAYLQLQLDEKQHHIEDLQKQNNLEDTIIEEQYPNIEETLALLAHGQSVILQKLKGGDTNESIK